MHTVAPTQLELSLQGAPNFRKADAPLEVYGVAQPTITGLKTILTVLQATPLRQKPTQRNWTRTVSHETARAPAQEDATPKLQQAPRFGRESQSQHTTPAVKPSASNPGPGPTSHNLRPPQSEMIPPVDAVALDYPQQEPRYAVWVCTREEPILYIGARPFVLREHSDPTRSFSLSSRAENLEAIERRLKQDVIREANRLGGLIMVHEEAGNSKEPTLKPTWISVDEETVKTVREVFEDLRSQGWRCDYHRVPIGQDQPIENS